MTCISEEAARPPAAILADLAQRLDAAVRRCRRAARSVAELGLGALSSSDRATPELSEKKQPEKRRATIQHQKKLQKKHFGLMAEW